MTNKKKAQIVVDFAMLVLLPILMAYELVGEAEHEWIGISMLTLFILHNALNWKWYKSLLNGRYTSIRLLGTVVNLLLLVIMISQMVSGIIMSRHAFTFLETSGGMTFARILHMLAAYWGFVLMSAHVGLHWNMIIGGIRKATHISKPSVAHIATLRMIAALINEPLIFFFADYVAIMGLFICVGYYVSNLIRKISTWNLSKRNIDQNAN